MSVTQPGRNTQKDNIDTLFDIDIFVDGLMQFVKKENKLQIPNLNNIHCFKANV